MTNKTSKYCLICNTSKYELEQFRRYQKRVMPCITINQRHLYKKRIKMPKIHQDQLEFIET